MPDFSWWLESFKESAFRLETLPAYDSPRETEMLAAFRRGEAVRLPDDFAWLRMVKVHKAAGRTMQRVRIVSSPLSDYERFELSLFPQCVEAGEDIRVTDDPELRYADFWLFDDQAVYILRYDVNGKFLGVDTRDDVVAYRAIRDRVLEYAIPLAKFAARATRA
jgi:uncharacterized protein DUF6879